MRSTALRTKRTTTYVVRHLCPAIHLARRFEIIFQDVASGNYRSTSVVPEPPNTRKGKQRNTNTRYLQCYWRRRWREHHSIRHLKWVINAFEEPVAPSYSMTRCGKSISSEGFSRDGNEEDKNKKQKRSDQLHDFRHYDISRTNSYLSTQHGTM